MEFRMAIQIIDNFLEEQEFNKLNNIMMGDSFPWYYTDFMTKWPDNKFYFTQTFYREPGIQSNWFDIWLPTIQKLKCKSKMRIKANNYTRMGREEKEGVNEEDEIKTERGGM